MTKLYCSNYQSTPETDFIQAWGWTCDKIIQDLFQMEHYHKGPKGDALLLLTSPNWLWKQSQMPHQVIAIKCTTDFKFTLIGYLHHDDVLVNPTLVVTPMSVSCNNLQHIIAMTKYGLEKLIFSGFNRTTWLDDIYHQRSLDLFIDMTNLEDTIKSFKLDEDWESIAIALQRQVEDLELEVAYLKKLAYPTATQELHNTNRIIRYIARHDWFHMEVSSYHSFRVFIKDYFEYN